MTLEKVKKVILLGAVLGLLTQPIFNLCGVYTGEKAIEYYAEVHTSKWNSLIHSLGMPFTYYGLLRCVPSSIGLLMGYNGETIRIFQLFFYPYFIFYYLTLDLYIGLILSVYYLPSQYYAMKHSEESGSLTKTIGIGFFVAFVALTIQEVFGHWVGGDDPSRIEAIPNAIWHAGFYSISHLINW